jgi:hypothetical protein
MKQHRKLFYLILILFMTAGFSGCSATSDDDPVTAEEISSGEPFQVGASVKALVPPDNPDWYNEVCIGGFGILGIRNFSKLMTARADGVHDPLYSRAMVISMGSKTIAFLVLDAAMLSNNVIKDITEGASVKTGIPAWQIYVAATHSHSSMDLLGYMGGVSDEYRAFLVKACIQTIVNASEDKTPVKLLVSQTQYNRMPILKDGAEIIKNGETIKWVYNRRGWTTLSAEEAKNYVKPNYSYPDVDSTINVLEAVDLETGKPKGVLINYACHPVIVTDDSRNLSRDFCGYLVDYVQKELGAPAIFIQGTQGDVNPGDWEDFGADKTNCYEFARQFGEGVAKQAIASMSDQAIISDEMYISGSTVPVIIDNPLMKLLLSVQKSLIDMTFTGKNQAKAHLAYIRLGKELQIVTYPGEPVTHMGLGINADQHYGKDGAVIEAIVGPKQLMKAPFKMVAGLTGDTLLYLVPSAEWNNSPDPMAGISEDTPYEEQMSMSIEGVFADECRKAVNRMIEEDTEMR